MVSAVLEEPGRDDVSTRPWSELDERFRRARRAALAKILETAAPCGPGAERVDEATDADRLDDHAFERLLRLLFEHALQLGLGFARTHGAVADRRELAELLSALDVPCFTGTWTHVGSDGASLLRRSRCSETASRRRCDYWREAMDGLALGLSNGELHHRRHASLGHGDPRCMDVLLEDAQSPLRFGPMGPELREALDRVRASLERLAPGVELEFLGCSEGQLAYRVVRAPEALAVRPMLERALARQRPDLTPMDVTPRPVLAGD